MYPNGSDVRALGLRLISKFDYAEANHNGVAVEEVPADVQAVHGFVDPVTSAKYEGIGRYSHRMCDGAEYLVTCFSADQARAVIAGSLSHSHLLLVLLCILTGAKWDQKDADGNSKFPCSRSGCVDASAVAGSDSVLKAILTEGLDMELLSYKIYLEEPDACTLISNALNYANSVALKTTELSALSSLTGAVGLSAVAGKLNYNTIKENLRATLDVMVDEPEFVEMFDFVVCLGADRNSYLPNFLKFTSKCVSSQFRRIRLQTFAVLNKCKAGPLGKIALAKRSLRSKPGAGGFALPPESDLTTRPESEFKDLEAILHFFHKTCEAAVAAVIPEGERPLFFANVDVAAASAQSLRVAMALLRSGAAVLTPSLGSALVSMGAQGQADTARRRCPGPLLVRPP